MESIGKTLDTDIAAFQQRLLVTDIADRKAPQPFDIQVKEVVVPPSPMLQPQQGGGTNAGTIGSGEGGDVDLDVETVTGAVNGVPATLNVYTDGSGWVEI